jgi:hypothetical protein
MNPDDERAEVEEARPRFAFARNAAMLRASCSSRHAPNGTE